MGWSTEKPRVAISTGSNGLPISDSFYSTRSGFSPKSVRGVILSVTALFLAIESQSLLTGEAASDEIRIGINRIARAEPGVAGPNQALTMRFAPNEVLAVLSLASWAP